MLIKPQRRAFTVALDIIQSQALMYYLIPDLLVLYIVDVQVMSATVLANSKLMVTHNASINNIVRMRTRGESASFHFALMVWRRGCLFRQR